VSCLSDSKEEGRVTYLMFYWWDDGSGTGSELSWLLGLFAEFRFEVISHSHSELHSGEVKTFSFLVRFDPDSDTDLGGFDSKFDLEKPDNVWFVAGDENPSDSQGGVVQDGQAEKS